MTLGLDDFASRLLGRVDEIVSPSVGEEVRVGDTLVKMSCGSYTAEPVSPVSGAILDVTIAS